ncbi:MAG: sigma-70 family RNA polymerase sigma factor [Candidatus Marinimicrobia bacterium]|nr:sigma-70 family RNA polymerase sigma factor [Candidatus Neomarinimicrobiota bacterium]MCF7830346.1 sigma-70 family RNA polymerase sigma factor [Candidatus Neomarinimicrobiota bacterium]MCF7882414.1 sigma-70 family RNA polymerase sigma factor [Candidatus Neomarinimicrobiota bacterium]
MNQTVDDLSNEALSALVDEAKQGKDGAQSRLISLSYTKIYRYIYYRVNQKEDAEDLTNDVFVRMLESLEQQRGSFLAWLYQIAKNRIVDYYRKQDVRSDTSDVGETIEYFESEGKPIDKMFMREELQKGINQLTEDQQDVIILRFIEGYQANEVAEQLDKSPTAVRQLQYRALNQLRKMIPEKE